MAFRVVLDSNVLVAGLRSQMGASFQLLRALRVGRFEIALSVPLVLEYEVVLARYAKELNLSQEQVISTVDYLCSIGVNQEIHFLWRPLLRDPSDEFILELAVAAQCHAIVTHNTGDFSDANRFGVQVLNPGQFLGVLGGPQ